MADATTEQNSLRQQYLKRHAALKSERATWDSHLKEISDHFYPRGARWLQSTRNQGTKQNQLIINGTPIRALTTGAAGMMSGVTPRSKPWFRLTTPDPALTEFAAVKDWLRVVEDRLRLAFEKSNAYLGFFSQYMALLGFGTAPMFMDEDPDDILRCYPVPVGRYCLANSSSLRIDTLYDELSMTVAQLVQQFGLESCSKPVKDAYNKGELDGWHDVLHVVEPNKAKQPGKSGPAGMAFRSCWMEMAGDDSTGFLREAGYEEFPVVCPRWVVTGEDVYGSSPAMDALGDAKALQLAEKRSAQGYDRVVNPPMGGPSSLVSVSLVPGSYTPIDSSIPGQVIQPLIEPNPAAMAVAENRIARLERSINAAMFANVWLMMAGRENDARKTATEVAALKDEQMQQLGPVTERLRDEMLDPAIDRAFAILLRAGQIPLPPKELSGMPLRVEYIGILAQAQKLLGITGLERLVNFVGNIALGQANAQRSTEVLDKLDVDQIVDEYGDMIGTPPNLVRSDDAVAAIRGQRAQAAQQAQKFAQMQQMADAAKTAAQAGAQPAQEGGGSLGQMLSGLGAPTGGIP